MKCKKCPTLPKVTLHCRSTVQTDLGLRSRTFSLKINKLPKFADINQGWQCLKIAFISEFQLHIIF